MSLTSLGPMKFILVVTLIATCTTDLYCQMSRKQIKRNNSRMMTYRGAIRNNFRGSQWTNFGVGLNALNYYGDLSPASNRISTDLKLTCPAIGLYFGTCISEIASIQVGLLYGTIRGSDHDSADPSDASNGIFRYQRNLSFRNRIKELSFSFHIDLSKRGRFPDDRRRVAPYLLIGVSAFHHNPQARIPSLDLQGNPLPNAGEWIDLKPLGTEGQNAELASSSSNHGVKPYRLFQFSIPTGMGFRFRLDDNIDIVAEISFRYLFTDYIDDVSRNYVDLGALESDVAQALSYRTNEVAVPNHSYTSELDGRTYFVRAGYGSEHVENVRGNKADNDTFMVSSLKITYLLSATATRRPKYR
jgi:hypothetical protein